MEQYPPMILDTMPFRVSKKRIDHIQLISTIRDLSMSASISSISKVHKAQHHEIFLRSERLYLLACKQAKTNPILTNLYPDRVADLPNKFGSFKDSICQPMSTTYMSKLLKNELQRLMPYAHGYISLTKGSVLKLDHSFWAASLLTDSNGKKSAGAVLTVMNEIGEIVASYVTESKSLNEVKHEFKMLTRRLNNDDNTVKVVYTDNPHADSNFLRDVLGNVDLPIKRDIFHCMQDIFRSCKAGPERKIFMSAVSNSFFKNDNGDQLSVEAEFIEKGWRLEDIRKMPSKWWQDKRRRYIRDPTEIIQKLNDLFFEYMSKNIFKDEMIITHSKVISQLEAGWYHDPHNVQMHFNISKENEPPRFCTCRGTSQLEGFHRCLQDLFDNCMSQELMHLLFVFFIYAWNITKAVNVRGSQILKVLDAQLQNDVKQLYLDLNAQEMPCHVKDHILLKPSWKVEKGPEPDCHETFGIIRFRYSSEAFQASQNALDVIQAYTAVEMENNDDSIALDSAEEFDFEDETPQHFIMDPQWALRLKRLIREDGHVTTDDEKLYFLAIIERFKSNSRPGFTNVNFHEMAIHWNTVVSRAILMEEPIRYADNGELSVDNFTFKTRYIHFDT
jgi:hypothetical protein